MKKNYIFKPVGLRQNQIGGRNLYWGNPDAISQSRLESVFDTSAGFTGVWHMSKDARGQYLDATPNANHGSGELTTQPQDALAGMGQRFNGSTDVIDCGNSGSLSLAKGLTISAWVQLTDFKSDRYYRIISKKQQWDGVDGYELECNPGIENGNGEVSVVGSTKSLARGYKAWDETWHHCAATIDDSASVYRDGADITTVRWWFDPIQKGDSPLRIGGIGDNNYFFGVIDAVRIEHVKRSGSWLKMCYETQRPDQRAVVVKRIR